jgi:hypothetical protein
VRKSSNLCSLRCILQQCFQDTNEALLKKLQVWEEEDSVRKSTNLCLDAETCSLRCTLKQCFQDTNDALLKKLQV